MKTHIGFAVAALLVAAGSLAASAEETTAPPATMSNNLKIKFIDQAPTDRLASKLIGTDIRNKADESIGSLSDIVFDENNRVRSYVVSVGGFLGVGSKYVAVDPSVVMMTPDKDKTKIVIDTDKDQLRAAPEYRYLSEQKKTSN